MGRFWIILFGAALISAASSAGQSLAGPWTRAEGEGFFIISERYFTTEFDESGDAAFRQSTLSLYGEYGLWDAITIGAEFDSAVGIPGKGSVEFGGQARAFARARLWQSDDGKIFSIEGSAGAISDIGKSPFADTRISLLYGEGWGYGWYDIAVSARFRDTSVDEFHSDATFGYRPAPQWLTFLQTNTIQRLAPKETEDSTTTKFGLFVGYEITPEYTVVAGARREFFSTFASPAVEASLSLWFQF